MKVTFVAEAYESLGIEYLSSMLKSKGHEVSLVYDPKLFNDAFCNLPSLYDKFFARHTFIERIISSEPDIIAFSVMSENYLWSRDIAREIKKNKNIAIFFGGIHPTSSPEYVIKEDCIDLVCVGEGESAFLEIADRFDGTGCIDATGIANIFFKKNGAITRNPVGHVLDDLDSLPFPDKQLFINEAPHMAKRYYIMTSRGCPFNCSFCYNSTLKNKRKYLRRRSGENVLKELKWALDNGIRYSYVMFGDDTFAHDKKWLRAFLDGYRRDIHRPFVCAIHPRETDSDTLSLLKDSGCSDIEIGIQTLNPRIRREILNRPESNEEILRAMDLIKRSKIRLIIDHIGGIPQETLKDYEEAVITYKKYNPNYIAFFWLAYYPETNIVKAALKNSVISERDRERIYQGVGLDGRGKYDIIRDEYLGFEFIFALIPILPEFVISYIIKHNLYRFVKTRAVGLMVFLPRFIRSMLDLNFRPFIRQISRYMDFFHYIKRRLAK